MEWINNTSGVSESAGDLTGDILILKGVLREFVNAYRTAVYSKIITILY
jgi:hypothetical protein